MKAACHWGLNLMTRDDGDVFKISATQQVENDYSKFFFKLVKCPVHEIIP